MRSSREAAFGTRVGGHDRLRRVSQSRVASGCDAGGKPATMRSTGSGSMITPVENGSTCVGSQPSRPASAAQVCARVRQAVLAGARVGVAGVDDQRADRSRRSRRRCSRADHHRRGAKAVLREHAGDRCAGRRVRITRRSLRPGLRCPPRRCRARRLAPEQGSGIGSGKIYGHGGFITRGRSRL